MALLRGTEVGVKRVGRTVSVPDSPTAKLMYYLDCLCGVLNIDQTEGDLSQLRDYPNYWRLPQESIDKLLILCILLSPDELMNKCIFQDDELCGDSSNRFYELSAVHHRLLVTQNIMIGGQQRRVQKIMCFKMSWLSMYYLEPVAYYQERLQRIANAVRGEAEPSQPQRPQIMYAVRGTAEPTQPQQPQIVYVQVPSKSGCCCTIL